MEIKTDTNWKNISYFYWSIGFSLEFPRRWHGFCACWLICADLLKHCWSRVVVPPWGRHSAEGENERVIWVTSCAIVFLMWAKFLSRPLHPRADAEGTGGASLFSFSDFHTLILSLVHWASDWTWSSDQSVSFGQTVFHPARIKAS